MNNNFYQLPLKPSHFFTKKEHEMCGLQDSIAHYIHLVNTTCFGECTFDDSFGCAIWEIDFDNLKSTNKLKAIILDSLLRALKKHEQRLSGIKINVRIKQEEIFGKNIANRIKKRVDLKVTGHVKKTNENFAYTEYFYIGPLSY